MKILIEMMLALLGLTLHLTENHSESFHAYSLVRFKTTFMRSKQPNQPPSLQLLRKFRRPCAG